MTREHREVSDQPAHRKHEPVVALEGDDAGDAQEGCRAHVVAGNGHAILPTANLATGSKISTGARKNAWKPSK